MAKKKSESLPSSLELLLDTMCNTFGGIMFIAIALVIVTQFASKSVMESITKLPTPEEKEALRRQLAELQLEVHEVEQKRINAQMDRMGFEPEAVAVVRQILETREELQAAMEEELEAKQLLQDAQEEQNKLDDQAVANQEELKVLQEEQLEAMEQLRREERILEMAKAEMKELQQACQDLKKKLASTKPAQTITFSMEIDRSPVDEMTIFINHGRFYTASDVSTEELGGDQFRVRFPAGRGHGASADEISRVFSSKSSGTVHIWVGDQSFNTLVEVRNFLRGKKIPVSWEYCSEFTFVRSSNVHRGVSF
ncbi:MAG: hypothetical protein II943_06830 [Victivallales bacterium]|nr:hypothetical protein [Victivallales bacterium]